LAGVGLAASLSLARNVHAAGSDVIKIGLVGCGGRGCGASVNAMNAGPDIRLVAMADLLEEKARAGRERVQKVKGEQVAVADDHLFAGFDGYEKLLATDIDAVIIATTSHFHPRIFEAAVKANKHIFCEKPHALDVPGLKRVTALCEEAAKRKLCVVSGLHNRYDPRVRATVQRVQEGAIGDVIAIQETYCVSPYHVSQRDPKWSEFEWQMRNWYHFNWLAGDQCIQQLIHNLSKSAWIMGDKPPVKAWGMGGRAACFGACYGDMFDHQTVVFEYPNGVRVFGLCRNHLGCRDELSDVVFGAKGRASLLTGRIEGQTNWEYDGPKPNPYDVEHQELFAAIRAGKVINNGDYMVHTTMLALMAQTVCHTGQEIAWDQFLGSTYSVELPRYGWDIESPVKPNAKGEYDIPIPGITKFA
jgi:predicted dehydrogenase